MKLRLVALALSVSLTLPLTARAKPPDKVTVAPSPKPLAQTLTGDAKVDYDAARLLAGDGDFAGAFLRFQSAFDKSHDARLLWNLAACQKNLRHYSKVIDLVKRYLAEGGALLTAQDRKDALDLVQTLDTFTTLAKIEVSEAGAEVFVDDDRLGVSPLPDRVRLDVGNRRVRAKKEGFLDFDKSLPVGGAPEVSIEVKLEKEVHEGKLVVTAPKNATIVIDGVDKRTEKLETTIASGGHTLRVTAPGMRPYQSEVSVKDNETRSVDVVLESLTKAALPQLRVAVGCMDTVARTADDGLNVYIDGSPATPLVAKRWSDDTKASAVDYVAFETSAGEHSVRVRIDGCKASDQVVHVDARLGGDLSGALESDSRSIWRGPAGLADGWRVGIALWLPASGVGNLAAYGAYSDTGVSGRGIAERYATDLGQSVGVMASGGWVSKWFLALAEAGIAFGTLRYVGDARFLQSDAFGSTVFPATPPITWYSAGTRFGPRLPLNMVALAMGLGGGVRGADVLAGNMPTIRGLYASAWMELDIEPFCDWALTNAISYSTTFKDFGAADVFSLQIGVAFQPSSKCRLERSTDLSLQPVPRSE